MAHPAVAYAFVVEIRILFHQIHPIRCCPCPVHGPRLSLSLEAIIICDSPLVPSYRGLRGEKTCHPTLHAIYRRPFHDP